jgi:hypothetical protein
MVVGWSEGLLRALGGGRRCLRLRRWRRAELEFLFVLLEGLPGLLGCGGRGRGGGVGGRRSVGLVGRYGGGVRHGHREVVVTADRLLW